MTGQRNKAFDREEWTSLKWWVEVCLVLGGDGFQNWPRLEVENLEILYFQKKK